MFLNTKNGNKTFCISKHPYILKGLRQTVGRFSVHSLAENTIGEFSKFHLFKPSYLLIRKTQGFILETLKFEVVHGNIGAYYFQRF